jgi:hypothetical protein
MKNKELVILSLIFHGLIFFTSLSTAHMPESVLGPAAEEIIEEAKVNEPVYEDGKVTYSVSQTTITSERAFSMHLNLPLIGITIASAIFHVLYLKKLQPVGAGQPDNPPVKL